MKHNLGRATFLLAHTEIWLRSLFRKKDVVQNYFHAVLWQMASQSGSSPPALPAEAMNIFHQRERGFCLEAPVLQAMLGKTSETSWE